MIKLCNYLNFILKKNMKKNIITSNVNQPHEGIHYVIGAAHES